MTDINTIKKKYCSQALLLAIALAMILLMLDAKSAARGVILGTLFSILNFILIAQSLYLQLGKGRGKTVVMCLGSIGVRYLLMALPLILAAKSQRFEFFTTATGLFMVQWIILSHHFGKILLGYILKTKKAQSVPLSGRDDL